MALSKIKKLILVEDAGAMIPAAGATCYVYHATTLTLAQMYTDRNGSVLASNPATIGSTGYLDRYIESGAYDLRVVSGLDETTYPDFLAVDDIIISGPSGELQFSDIANLKAATPLNQKSYKVNWASQLGRKISVVVNNTTSNEGGADYVITNVNPGNLSTLVGGIWVGVNHDLGGGFYAELLDTITPSNCGYTASSVNAAMQSINAAGREIEHSASNYNYETAAQNTSYAMDINRHVFGEEYLWGFHKYVFDNNNNANCKFVWSGDSTTAGDNAGGYTPSFIGSLVSSDLGLARHQHVNSGHSGKAATHWDSLYLGQDIVNHPDMNVYIARWGINDGFWHNNVETYIDAMDSALTNLRVFKDVEDLAIVVVSPSSTFDDPTNRGTAWYESIIPELRKICRKHQAMFVDIYAIWQDAKQGALNTGSSSTGKRWLDNPYGDGRGIHPDAAFACQIGLRITELIVKPALVKSNIKNNMVANIHPDQFRPLSNVQPNNYPRFIGCYTVNQSDGWPFDGKLRTTRNGSKVIQELFITTAEDTTEVGNVIPKKKIVRFGDATAGLWSKWYNRAVAPGLVGGWTQHNSQVQKYVHREDGLCTIEGSVENGIDGNPIFSIPVEMRPTSNKRFITLSSAGFYGIVTVQTNGDVIASKNGGTFCGLDGVVWTAGD